jgi:hypothetical protein
MFSIEDLRPEELDDWSRCSIEQAEEIKDLFIEPFYFGCEADDPTNTWAFDKKVNPFGARLKAIFGSDIAHWDVPDMNNVVAEAHELVDKSMITTEDFRDFTFTNAVTLYTGMNSEFFNGTRVESSVSELLNND